MQAGSLRHRVTIQTSQSGNNPFQTGTVWTPVVTLWASIQPLTSKEVFQAGQINMKVSHRIIIRYPGSQYMISAGDQVVFLNRTFLLEQGIINPDERNVTLELLAFETTANQGTLLA